MDNTLIDRIVGVFSRAAMPIVSCALAMAIAFIPGTALAGADDEGDGDPESIATHGALLSPLWRCRPPPRPRSARAWCRSAC